MSDLKSEWVKENFEMMNAGELVLLPEEIPQEIRRLAYENSNARFCGVVYGNSDGECWGVTWSGNTTLSPDSECVEVFRARANWIDNWNMENIFGVECDSVLDYARKNGLNPDYEYDEAQVVDHAQEHNLVNGDSWKTMCIEAQLDE